MEPDRQALAKAHQNEIASISRQLGGNTGEIPNLLMNFAALKGTDDGRSVAPDGTDFTPVMKAFEDGPMAIMNERARRFRANTRAQNFAAVGDIRKSRPALAKAALDVGFGTSIPSFVQGQAISAISLDTRVARGTIRPNSFTLYQALNKTRAAQVVDYWPYASSTGGAAPGATFGAFSSQTAAIAYNQGKYDIKYLTLKLQVDGRAMTLALAQQASFLNVAEQETANGALSILTSTNWSLYWGNPALWPNQFQGIYGLLPARNVIDFQAYYNAVGTVGGYSNAQALYNCIYETVGAVSNYLTFGHVTHAFMATMTAGSLQTIVTTKLMEIANDLTSFQRGMPPIVINGDLQGMKTRFGDVQFPIDQLMTARDIPLAGQINEEDGTTLATTTSPTPPVSVTAAVSGAIGGGTGFTSAYAPGTNNYRYAVASTDQYMNESTLTWVNASTVVVNGQVVLTITPPADVTATVFRVFRSSLNYSATGTDPTQVRWIGDVAANGASTVTFTDTNAHIPGSETIFLLDLDEGDDALDYRWLLPLSKIELFAQALFMPWALCHIGAPRVRVPKFHAAIKNYVPENAIFSPLGPV